MRGHFLNYRAIGQALLYVGAVVAIIAVGVWLIRHSQHRAIPRTDRTATNSSADVLQQQLARCQAIGTAAQSDQSCIAAWSENRRRFFGGGAP